MCAIWLKDSCAAPRDRVVLTATLSTRHGEQVWSDKVEITEATPGVTSMPCPRN